MDTNHHNDFKHTIKVEPGSRKLSQETPVKIEPGSRKCSQEIPVKIESGSRNCSQKIPVKIESGSRKCSQEIPVKIEPVSRNFSQEIPVKIEPGSRKCSQEIPVKIEPVSRNFSQEIPVKFEPGSRKCSQEIPVKTEPGNRNCSQEIPVKIEQGILKRRLETQVEIKSGSRKRSQTTPVNARIPKNETKQQCYFDGYANTITIEASFAHARSSLDKNQIACYVASALCAYQDGFMTAVKTALEEHGVALNVIKLPSGAEAAGINLNVIPYQFNKPEILMFTGLWFILLFKNLSQANSSNFISKRVCALGGKLGVAKKRIEDFKYLIQFNQAKAIRYVLGSSKVLKHKVRQFVNWLSGEERESSCSMALYVRMFIIPPDPPSMDINQALSFLWSLGDDMFPSDGT